MESSPSIVLALERGIFEEQIVLGSDSLPELSILLLPTALALFADCCLPGCQQDVDRSLRFCN